MIKTGCLVKKIGKTKNILEIISSKNSEKQKSEMRI